MNLLFIVGIQKSGTSLLNRLLLTQNEISNPFLPEGRYFWGDNPPDNPVDKPCGELFQQYGDLIGHHLSEKHYRKEDQLLLWDRIKDANVTSKILMNKNPYNTVRIAWLKAIFPDCHIVAMVRSPIPNIYSLLKKRAYEQELGNLGSSNWWGIKPKSWKNLVSSDPVKTVAHQWRAVHQEVLQKTKYIDSFINYTELCKDPNGCLLQVLKPLGVNHLSCSHSPLKCFDSEFQTGSRLMSKNFETRRDGVFNLKNLKEDKEFPPLSNKQIDSITNITAPVWKAIQKAASLKRENQ